MFIPVLLAVICRRRAYCVYLSMFFVQVCVFVCDRGRRHCQQLQRWRRGRLPEGLWAWPAPTTHRHTLPPLLLKHPLLLTNLLLFPSTDTLLHTNTHTHTTEEERRTPNAISTPLSTFVLMNRGGLVIRQAACCCSRAAGSQNIQAA